MHHIHRTRAYVLKSIPFKEADKQLHLLTEDLGLVRAVAQGSRKLESKMRQSVQDFSLINAALVSGRTGWRLVNVSFEKNFYSSIQSSDWREALNKVFSLIDRLVAGEMPDKLLFQTVANFVESAEKISLREEFAGDRKAISTLETIFVSRILNILGYFDHPDARKILSEEIDADFLLSVAKGKAGMSLSTLTRLVNESIRDSNL